MPGSFIPPYDANNVVTGVASMYTQPWSRTVTADIPADTVELGTTWETPWVPIGATDSGLEWVFARKTNQITIEEQIIQVDEVTTSLDCSFNIDLAEDTVETLLLATGGGSIVTAAAATSTPGTNTLTLSTDLDAFAFGFEVMNQFGFFRRIAVPKVKSIANMKTKFSRAKDKRMYSVTFQALCAPEEIIIHEMTAVATGP